MEKKLDQIITNTSPKTSFLVTLTGKGSKLEKSFEPEISIKPGCHYEIAFASLETFNSIPNVNPTNNVIEVAPAGKPWKTVKIDTGCYGLMDINREIGRILKDEGMPKAVEFKANYNTFKCTMIIQPGFAVNFNTKSSLRTILGFDKKAYKATSKVRRFVAEHMVQILKVNSILVHCDLVGSSYLNGTRVPVIHSFFPNAEPGDKIIEKPVQYIYLPISSDVIRHMSVWLTDQDQHPIDLREETLTIKFHLKSC